MRTTHIYKYNMYTLAICTWLRGGAWYCEQIIGHFLPHFCVGIFLFRGQYNRLICNARLRDFFLLYTKKMFQFSYLPSSLINVRKKNCLKAIVSIEHKIHMISRVSLPQFDSTTMSNHLMEFFAICIANVGNVVHMLHGQSADLWLRCVEISQYFKCESPDFFVAWIKMTKTTLSSSWRSFSFFVRN